MYKKNDKKCLIRIKFCNICLYVLYTPAKIANFVLSYNGRMKYLLILSGTLSLLLGIVGVFVPVLPTTPFLLLSATLYLHSSQRLYGWLMSHPCLGEYIRNFREHKAVPLRVKVVSVALVWLTLLYCAVFVAVEWWMRLVFVAIALGVSVHILHYRTLRK